MKSKREKEVEKTEKGTLSGTTRRIRKMSKLISADHSSR